jgi:hypothetical protein
VGSGCRISLGGWLKSGSTVLATHHASRCSTCRILRVALPPKKWVQSVLICLRRPRPLSASAQLAHTVAAFAMRHTSMVAKIALLLAFALLGESSQRLRAA